MKSTFKAALIITGIALFGVLFVACGFSDSEEPAPPAPAHPAAPAAQPAPAPDEPVAEAPSMVQQQPAPAQPAKAPQAPMPAQAASAAGGSRPASAVRTGVDAMAMERASSSDEDTKTESASAQGPQATRALPAPETGQSLPSAEDIAKAVADGFAAGMKDTQRATQDEVAQAVQSAVAAATAGQVTRGDIEEVVAKSVQEAASGGLTAADVQKIVESSLHRPQVICHSDRIRDGSSVSYGPVCTDVHPNYGRRRPSRSTPSSFRRRSASSPRHTTQSRLRRYGPRSSLRLRPTTPPSSRTTA